MTFKLQKETTFLTLRKQTIWRWKVSNLLTMIGRILTSTRRLWRIMRLFNVPCNCPGPRNV